MPFQISTRVSSSTPLVTWLSLEIERICTKNMGTLNDLIKFRVEIACNMVKLVQNEL